MHMKELTRKGRSNEEGLGRSATSTTRVLSSETYLRRLFVTADLAHVLSLDECLPRSMPFRRSTSSRREGARGNESVPNDPTAEVRKDPFGNIGCTNRNYNINSDADIKNDAGNNRDPLSSNHDAGTFKKYFPVTLIDSEGNRWSVTYATTRRDNLHSGRLIDGWERFCNAKGLRVGNMVEFVKIERTAQNREVEGSRQEAIARVITHRRR